MALRGLLVLFDSELRRSLIPVEYQRMDCSVLQRQLSDLLWWLELH